MSTAGAFDSPLSPRRAPSGRHRKHYYKNDHRTAAESCRQRRMRALLLRDEARCHEAARRRVNSAAPLDLVELAETVTLAFDDVDGCGFHFQRLAGESLGRLDLWRKLAVFSSADDAITFFATLATLWSASDGQSADAQGDAPRAALLALVEDDTVALSLHLSAALAPTQPLALRTEALWLLVCLGSLSQLRDAGSTFRRVEVLQHVSDFAEWLAHVVPLAASADLATVVADSADADETADYVEAFAYALQRIQWAARDAVAFTTLLSHLCALGARLLEFVAAPEMSVKAEDARQNAVACVAESLALAVAAGAAPGTALFLPIRATLHFGGALYALYEASEGAVLSQPGGADTAACLATCVDALARVLGRDMGAAGAALRDHSAGGDVAGLAVALLRAFGLTLTETWAHVDALDVAPVLATMCILVTLSGAQLPDDEQAVEALTEAARRLLALGLREANKLEVAVIACLTAGAVVPNLQAALTKVSQDAVRAGKRL